MKILLTHGYFLHEDAREQQIMRPYPPLGLLYVSAYLEHHGFEHEVYDTTFTSKTQLYQEIVRLQPAIIGIYVNLMTKPNVVEIIGFIRNSLANTKIILGGPEVTHHVESFLGAGADFAVIGEGEETMLQLVRAITTSADISQLKQIEGIAFMLDDRCYRTPAREKFANLDLLPWPNRKKIQLGRYLTTWKEHHGINAMSVSTMRGCPYTCRWCSRAVYGLSYRRRSPAHVVQELEEIYNTYRPDTFWFVDDVFTINYRWMREFNRLLKERQLQISYECITRADRMNEEVVHLLKDTGCFRVWIGAESGSQRVIDQMDRRVDVQQVRKMIQLSRKFGIEAGTFIMLGYPGETEEDIELTIDHLKASNPDHFTITVAYPIKGTEFYDEVKEAIMTLNDWSTSTDRDIDFQRRYSRRYYDYAVSRVTNEVRYFQSKNGAPSLDNLRYKIKSMAAKAGMLLARTF